MDETARPKFLMPLLCFAAAFMTAFALCIDPSAGAKGFQHALETMRGNSVLIFFVFFSLAVFYYKTPLFSTKRKMIYAAAGAVLFSASESIGYCFNHYNALLDMTVSKTTAALQISMAIGMFFLFYATLAYLFDVLDKHDFTSTRQWPSRFFCDDTRSFFWVAAVLVILWLPYYLAYFPGAATWDTHIQIGQIFGYLPLSNHHPVIHTELMGLFIRFGKAVFGTIAGGVAVFTSFQMLALAFLYSFVIFYMARREIHPAFRILTLLFYGLYPVNAVYSITPWKDIWSSAFILLYVVFLVEISINQDNFFSSGLRLFSLALILLGMFFFKHIGIFVFLISLPFLLFTAKKYYKQILLVSLCCIAFYAVVDGPVFSILHIQKDSTQQILSVPLQQIARTVKEHGTELTNKEKEAIGNILPYDQLPELYNPRLSDPVKGSFDATAFQADKWRYSKLWAELFIKYPGTYFNSFIAGSFGYWYPEAQNPIIAANNYIQDEIIHAESYPDQVWDENLDSYTQPNLLSGLKIASSMLNSSVRNLPILSMLFSVGFINWVLLICALVCGVQKRRRALLPFSAMFGVFLTCLASPVFLEFRYAYSAVLCLPLMIAFTLTKHYALSEHLCKKSARDLQDQDS
jgi:hypothetical protein